VIHSTDKSSRASVVRRGLPPVNLREARFGYIHDVEGLEGVALSKNVPGDELFRCSSHEV
jgi:hypothetical protein